MSVRSRRREALGAAATAILLCGLVLSPPYRGHPATAVRQLRLLPQRVRTPLEDMRGAVHGESFDTARWIRERTPETAAILLSDDPRDGRLTSTLWLAYYLYPRPLVTPAALRRHPSIHVDFVLITPHFPPALPDSLRGPGLGLAPFAAVAAWLDGGGGR